MGNLEWAPTSSQCFTDLIRHLRSLSSLSSRLSLPNLSCSRISEAYFLLIIRRPYKIVKNTTLIDTLPILVKVNLGSAKWKDLSILCESFSQFPRIKLNQRTYCLLVTRVFSQQTSRLWTSIRTDHVNNSLQHDKELPLQTRLKS